MSAKRHRLRDFHHRAQPADRIGGRAQPLAQTVEVRAAALELPEPGIDPADAGPECVYLRHQPRELFLDRWGHAG